MKFFENYDIGDGLVKTLLFGDHEFPMFLFWFITYFLLFVVGAFSSYTVEITGLTYFNPALFVGLGVFLFHIELIFRMGHEEVFFVNNFNLISLILWPMFVIIVSMTYTPFQTWAFWTLIGISAGSLFLIIWRYHFLLRMQISFLNFYKRFKKEKAGIVLKRNAIKEQLKPQIDLEKEGRVSLYE